MDKEYLEELSKKDKEIEELKQAVEFEGMNSHELWKELMRKEAKIKKLEEQNKLLKENNEQI